MFEHKTESAGKRRDLKPGGRNTATASTRRNHTRRATGSHTLPESDDHQEMVQSGRQFPGILADFRPLHRRI